MLLANRGIGAYKASEHLGENVRAARGCEWFSEDARLSQASKFRVQSISAAQGNLKGANHL